MLREISRRQIESKRAERQHLVLLEIEAGDGYQAAHLPGAQWMAVSAIANNYSFGISGIDSSNAPMAIAGRFLSDGAGTFPVNFAIQDVNDAGTITQADLSLHGNIFSIDGGTSIRVDPSLSVYAGESFQQGVFRNRRLGSGGATRPRRLSTCAG